MTLRTTLAPRVCAWLVILLMLWPLLHLAWFEVASQDGASLSPGQQLEQRRQPDTGERQALRSTNSRVNIAWATLGRTILVAAAAAGVAGVLGACMALAITLSGLPAKPLWGTLLLVPLACPPTVWTLGRLYAFGPGGLLSELLGEIWWPLWLRGEFGSHAATTLVLAEAHAPLAMLVVARGATALRHRGWESAQFYLPTWRLPAWLAGALRRELAAAWLLTFLLCLGNFAVPHVMQCRLYAIEIYALLTNYLDPRGAALYAAPLLAIGLVASVFLSLCLRSESTDAPRPAAERPAPTGPWSWFAAVGLGSYILLTSGLTIGALVRECGNPTLLARTIRDAAPETGHSLTIGLGAATVGAVAGWVVGSWAARRQSLAAGALSLAPLAVPTLVVGLAYSRFCNSHGVLDLAWVGNTSLLVMLGLGFRVWPFATRIVETGSRRIPTGWRETAQLAGLRGWRGWWWIQLPLTYEFVVTGALLGFVFAVGDVEISQMLCAPGTGTLSLRLFTFLHFGPRHVAAGLALLLLSLSLIPVLIYFLFANRYPRWF